MNDQIKYSIGLITICGMLSSGCTNTSENSSVFESDTMRVVSVQSPQPNNTTITVVDRYGNLYTGPCSKQSIAYPQRGDTIIASRTTITSNIIRIHKNLTTERIIREFATKHK